MNSRYETIKEGMGKYLRQSISYPSLMRRHIKKHSSCMQPFFEAISNSLEATKGVGDTITVRIQMLPTTNPDKYSFLSLEVEDTGIGFNDENFDRLQRLYDETKNCNNFGTGRIQYLHFFDITDIHSVFEKDGKKYARRIVLSLKFYARNKGVMWCSDIEEVNTDVPTGTSISFFYPLNDDDKAKYNELTADDLYEKIYIHYLSRFCMNKGNLQRIVIETYINEIRDENKCREIRSNDIPTADYESKFQLKYQVYDKDHKTFLDSKEKESFSVLSYLLPHKIQKKNEIKLTSKNETVDAVNFDFSFLDKTSKIGDKYMLCLVSSDFFTRQDSDERGRLRLKTKSELLKANDMYEIQEPHIFIDNIQQEVVKQITSQYPEIKKVKEDYEQEMENLINLFGLDRNVIAKIGYKYGESTASFLKRYKEYNAEIAANNEANMNSVIDSLRNLNPSDANFKDKFNRKVREITRMIPQKNRTDVTNYIVSRKAAMTMLDFILQKQLESQKSLEKSKQKNREKIIHDLLFKQRSTNTLESNLWILNEDFIHYKGISESQLRDIKINDELFLREDLTEEEQEKLKAYNHDQLGKRTDILLFPEEHKCIIIELKSATADVTKFLNQVIDYAGLIRQYAKEKFEITNFYAYLIGESFDFEAILNSNPNFVESPYLDYVYIPDQKVYGGRHREKGTMYFEVLKYSSLLARAEIRNRVFMDKLFDKKQQTC